MQGKTLVVIQRVSEDEKRFIAMTPGPNFIKLFRLNYVTIGVTSVKAIVKLCLKSFIIMATGANATKLLRP